jgi:hypothetical protein
LRLQDRRRVLGARVDHQVCAQILGQFQLLVGDVDSGDPAAEDLRLLHGQVAQAAHAGNGHQVTGPDVADLDRLERGHPGAGERRRHRRVDAVGHQGCEGGVGGEALGIAAVD